MVTCNWEPKDFASVTKVIEGFAKKLKEKGGYIRYSQLECIINENLPNDNLLKENINLIKKAETNNYLPINFMNYKIIEGFKKIKEILNSPHIKLEQYKDIIIDDEADINYISKQLQNIGYNSVKNIFSDVLNVEVFKFYGNIELNEFYSKIEVNIAKVYPNLTLLDYDEKLWFEGQSEEEKALWKTFRSFDTRPEIGDGKMAVFSIQEGVSPPNEPAIYYIDRAKAFKTNLTFVQYYETVLDMMGIADWQLLFTDVSWNDPQVEDYYPELKAAIEALAKAFPDKDYKKYLDLLEARWV